ncbi:MAG: hypothetical protein SFY96_12020 [Planctomycetota bacterium]|nr:hypothetical protein [Planctomycetota bacterium]
MSDRRDNISWLVGALVSGVIHLGAAVGAARYGTFIVPPSTNSTNPDSGVDVALLPPDDLAAPDAALPPPPPPPPPLPLPQPPEEQRQSVMRLGIRESSQNTDAWLGFDTPDEHSGMLSTLDQAALALDPGIAGMPGDAAQAPGNPTTQPTPPAPSDSLAAPSPQPAPQPAPQQQPAPDAAIQPASQPQPQPQPEIAPRPEQPLPDGEPAPGAARGTPDAPRPDAPAEHTPQPTKQPVPQPTQQPAPPDPASSSDPATKPTTTPPTTPPDSAKLAPDAAPQDVVEVRDDPLLPPLPTLGPMPLPAPAQGSAPPPTPAQQAQPAVADAPSSPATQPASPTTPAAGMQGSAKATPGNKSDRESDAASKKGPLEVRPGKPAAGQGLEIQTVRPQWSITTRLTAVPRNPMVRIVFGPDGKVKTAGFLTGQDTGSPDIDGPLLDAIYRWTAKGKAIDELPKNNPKAGVPLVMRIVLRG